MKRTDERKRQDALGKTVVPIELWRTSATDVGDTLEIRMDGDDIVLAKDIPTCAYCPNALNLTDHKGKLVCRSCLEELYSL